MTACCTFLWFPQCNHPPLVCSCSLCTCIPCRICTLLHHNSHHRPNRILHRTTSFWLHCKQKNFLKVKNYKLGSGENFCFINQFPRTKSCNFHYNSTTNGKEVKWKYGPQLLLLSSQFPSPTYFDAPLRGAGVTFKYVRAKRVHDRQIQPHTHHLPLQPICPQPSPLSGTYSGSRHMQPVTFPCLSFFLGSQYFLAEGGPPQQSPPSQAQPQTLHKAKIN